MLSARGNSVLFLGAILGGSAIGLAIPGATESIATAIDPLVLLLVGAVFFTLRLDGARDLRGRGRMVLIAVGTNFFLVPLVALALTAFLPHEALRLGVLIYCLAPCTDWFLGFTRVAGGDTTTGAALIPVQMSLQLLLYPLWLSWFGGAQVTAPAALSTLLLWFVAPAGIGLGLRALLTLLPRPARTRTLGHIDGLVPFLIAAVIIAIFAVNVETILDNAASFWWALLVVFLFFVALYLIGEGITRLFRLDAPQHALLAMTTSARNAPLMLAVTTIALPGQPLVSSAIVLGMLIEFPHLTVLTHLVRVRHGSGSVAQPTIAVQQP